MLSSAPPPPRTLISRRWLLQYETEMQKAVQVAAVVKQTKDDTPWPRSVVYGAYAAMALFLPYTAAWFLSTNERLRRRVLPDRAAAPLLESMRHHFGVPDWQCLSEPETLVVHPMPHKFVDEPTARLRQQQAWIQRYCAEGTVWVQITSRGAEGIAPVPPVVLELPASTRASPAALAKVVPVVMRPPLALDCVDLSDETEPENSKSEEVAASPDRTPMVPILSIYSLWHYQAPLSAPPSEPSAAAASGSRWSPGALELSRVNYEIDQLQAELQQASQSHRSIDDLQAELARWQRARRRLQWRRLWE
jgi:hypothetical protein